MRVAFERIVGTIAVFSSVVAAGAVDLLPVAVKARHRLGPLQLALEVAPRQAEEDGEFGRRRRGIVGLRGGRRLGVVQRRGGADGHIAFARIVRRHRV